MERLQKLYVGKREEEIFCIYYGKMCAGMFAIVLLSAVMFLIVLFMPSAQILYSGSRLQKDAPNGKEKTVELKVWTDAYEKEMTLPVTRQTYTREQLERQFAEIRQRIEQSYLGENASADYIDKPLVLQVNFADSAVSVHWDVGSSGLINADGTINNATLTVSKQVKLQAVLSYGDIKEKWVKQLTIYPVQKTEEAVFWEKWQEVFEANKTEESCESYISLPETVDGQAVYYKENDTSKKYVLLVICGVMFLALPLYMERNVLEQLKKREEELRTDYPDFVERLVLLMGAGLNVRKAWERIVEEYEKSLEERGERRFVYEEMQMSLQKMENGWSESRAYELFGKRTGLLSYMKLSTLLVQNLKKGSSDLLKQLEQEVEDAFEIRKENAKMLGEKAGTKLLLPMALMLGIVFAIILYAAFQGM